MNLNDILTRLDGVKGRGNSYTAKCPAHEDRKPSLSIKEDGGKVLLHCFAGCRTEDILRAIGIEYTDLFQEPRTSPSGRRVLAEYTYTDPEGESVAVKVRYSDKTFFWRRPDGSPGRGETRPLYNWYKVKDKPAIFLVEGEKDVDTLAESGFPAVSFPDGANSKWYSEYADFFRGKSMILLPDNDSPGERLMNMAAEKILPLAKNVRTVHMADLWPNAPEKADISDFLASGGTVKELAEAVKKAAPMRPPKLYKCFSEIKSTETQWLWYPYIPRGKIVLLTAAPGIGKTFLSLYLCGALSDGRPFMGEPESASRQPERAVYQSAEDGIADTLKKRLEQLCPEPRYENIFNIDETEKGLTLADTDRIEEVLRELHPALVIFDPIQAYLGADVDMHRANEVRPIMARIGTLAERYNCTFLMIMHNSKMHQSNAIYVALGSVDIPAVSRSMLMLDIDPDDENRLILCHSKSSLAKTGKSILFHIEEGDLRFDGFSDKTADDIYCSRANFGGRRSEKSDLAAEILSDLLDKHQGWVSLGEVQREMKRCDISKNIFYKIKDEMKLRSVCIGRGRDRSAYWLASEVDPDKFKQDRLKIMCSQAQ